MRKWATVLLLVAALLVVLVAPSLAGGKRWTGSKSSWSGSKSRTTVVVGVGPAFWWWYPWYPYPYPYWYRYPYWYYPPPYYGYPLPPAEPPVYIEQSTQVPQAPPGYWYYCQSAKAYYPNVQTCPEVWIKVAPRSE
jgi:hypothetical protein